MTATAAPSKLEKAIDLTPGVTEVEAPRVFRVPSGDRTYSVVISSDHCSCTCRHGLAQLQTRTDMFCSHVLAAARHAFPEAVHECP